MRLYTMYNYLVSLLLCVKSMLRFPFVSNIRLSQIRWTKSHSEMKPQIQQEIRCTKGIQRWSHRFSNRFDGQKLRKAFRDEATDSATDSMNIKSFRDEATDSATDSMDRKSFRDEATDLATDSHVGTVRYFFKVYYHLHWCIKCIKMLIVILLLISGVS